MALLFDYHINYYSDSENRSNVPFTVFGLSQQGLSHEGSSIGNQDAGNIYVGRNIIIGAVADGCTSGYNLNGKSSNQVGASITSYLVVRIARKLALKNHLPISSISSGLETSLLHHYKRILNSLNPWKFERNRVIGNLLTSTFILFVLTQKEYLILSCGDGDVFINGVNRSLVGDGDFYFSNNLLENNIVNFDYSNHNIKVQIKCVEKGQTIDLQNLLIATDGFADRDIKSLPEFSRFFFDSNEAGREPGVNDFKPIFRKTVLDEIIEEKNGKPWPLDDATFISVKRI